MKHIWILEHPRVGVARSCGTVLEIVNERRAKEMLLQFQTAGPAPDCMDWRTRELTAEEMKILRSSGHTKIR